VTDPVRCVAIVGAGFCGTVTAINLLRQAHLLPLRILLIDHQPHGRGAAYGPHADQHLLNVPAGRMSAFSADPLDFLRYAQRRMPGATAEDFLPRTLYGDYLDESLSAAEHIAPFHVRLERVREAVCSLELLRPSHTYILGFKGGRERVATEVVLALGNPPPTELPGAEALRASARLIENPWSGPATLAPNETILLVGTGLTMADIVVSAMNSPGVPRRVHAISRHGLLPADQTAFGHGHLQFDPLPFLQAASLSLRQVVRLVRGIAREAEQHGGDWREAVTFVRTLAPRLWSRLPTAERRRFLRHVRPYWDVHRHRLPPSTRAEIDALRDSQQLLVHAGRILKLEPDGERVRVSWRPRAQDTVEILRVDRVINCTGPDYRCRASHDPLIKDLLNTGLIQTDALQLGLQVSANGGVLNITGRPTRGLHYIGPMLRAQYWEATAVQELREHAERLAQQLVATAVDGKARPGDAAATAT
jgi:uncharacterized NAD(P)/FAD-binding protein YdhS